MKIKKRIKRLSKAFNVSKKEVRFMMHDIISDSLGCECLPALLKYGRRDPLAAR